MEYTVPDHNNDLTKLFFDVSVLMASMRSRLTRKMNRRLENSTTALFCRMMDSPASTGVPFTTTGLLP